VDDQAKAREVVEEAGRAKTFDEPNFGAAYALAAVPARWALERRDWKAAAALELPALDLPWSQYPYVPATTYFSRALGAARTGQLEAARESLAKLQQIQTDLTKTPIPGPYNWAGNVESMRLAAAGILARAEHHDEEAIRLLRSAAELDEKTGKHPVTPGPILPARELLADVLLETNRPVDALAEYENALREAPNRFNSLAGAARAAERAGKSTQAAELYGRLIKMAVPGAQRPELAEAQKFMPTRQ
jgi:tetratricopeptide (TPR) repeat protein